MRVILSGLAGLAFLALAACASTIAQTTAERAFAAQADYNVALAAAVRYVELPRCEAPTAPTPCSKAAVVAEIRKADAVAGPAFQLVQGRILARASEASISLSLGDALRALQLLQAVLTTYGIS